MSSSYASRPWLALYPESYDPDLKPTAHSPLDHLRRTVADRAEAPAIFYFDRVIDYRQLDAMSDALACALLDLGMRPGDRVALYLQNIPQFVIGQFGVWKAGGIVVPLNPMYKEKELTYYFEDAAVKVLIAMEALYRDVAGPMIAKTGVQQVITTSELDFLEKAGPRPVILEGAVKLSGLGSHDFLDLVGRYRGERPPKVSPTEDDVAYLTYTSGTTGPPKGAMNTHGNVAFNSEVYLQCWGLRPKDVILGIAPLFHVTGMVGHIGAAVTSGAALVLFYRFDPATALRMIERRRATATIGAITAFIALMNAPEIKSSDLSSLRTVYSGGAPVIPAIVDRFAELTGSYIHNIYGLTESTSPTHIVPRGARAPVDPSTGALSIGVPIPGHLAKIVDLTDPSYELEPGQVGELAVKGPGIVPGYWQKPEETVRAIRDGWLFTGDVGTMDDQGWFYVLDRKKDMIIASGFKVWPREVEDTLYQHPAVREVAVVGLPDAYRGETVKAFVALKVDYEGQVTGEELMAFCKTRLAAYKYPREIEFVDEVPKTATGKFLRRALRKT